MSSVIMPTSGIHETAIIYPSAKIGKDVSVGPYAVIDEDTEIADDCIFVPLNSSFEHLGNLFCTKLHFVDCFACKGKKFSVNC